MWQTAAGVSCHVALITLCSREGDTGSQWQYGLVKHLGRSTVSKHPQLVRPTHTKYIQTIIMKIQCFLLLFFKVIHELKWSMKEYTMISSPLHTGSVFCIIFYRTFLRIWNAKTNLWTHAITLSTWHIRWKLYSMASYITATYNPWMDSDHVPLNMF